MHKYKYHWRQRGISVFEVVLISQGLWKASYPNCTRDHSSDRSPDKQSYDQTNTGALIRPACSSANPGIQGAALTLPHKDHLPRGDTDPADLMSTPKRCLGAIMESKVLSQRMRHVRKQQAQCNLPRDKFWVVSFFFFLFHKCLPSMLPKNMQPLSKVLELCFIDQ